MKVISLFDTTGLMLKPWAEAGYECHAYDIQNENEVDSDGIIKHNMNLYVPEIMDEIARSANDVVGIFAFPPCTDLSIAGARWWAKKAKENPSFQEEAADRIKDVQEWCEKMAERNGCFYMIENPRGSKLNDLWRKYDYSFSPHEYGAYLPENDVHPIWPSRIPPRDAYFKKTALWTCKRFIMPSKSAVEAHRIKVGNRYHSPIFTGYTTAKLRSATPRGFARAVYESNSHG